MEISKETRDRLLADLSLDELQAELDKRRDFPLPGVYRQRMTGEVVYLTGNGDEGITLNNAHSLEDLGYTADRYGVGDLTYWQKVEL